MTGTMTPGLPHKDDAVQTAERNLEYVTLQLKEQIFGINVLQVIEVIRFVDMAEAPEAADYVVGLINFRGQVVPAIDMRLRFKVEPTDFSLATPIIIARLPSGPVALIVDEMSEVVPNAPTMVGPVPADVSVSKCISQIARADHRLIF